MPSSLSGARAIVTGGGRGIGLAIAKLFASEGASISLVGRDQARLRTARETLESLPNQSDASHRTHAFDVGVLDGWDAMLADLKADNIDVLVNAAGIAQNSLLSRTRAQDAQDIVNTNLMGTIWGCQTVGKRMTRQRHGCIVNVSSLLATHAGRGASVYSASKAGIVGVFSSIVHGSALRALIVSLSNSSRSRTDQVSGCRTR